MNINLKTYFNFLFSVLSVFLIIESGSDASAVSAAAERNFVDKPAPTALVVGINSPSGLTDDDPKHNGPSEKPSLSAADPSGKVQQDCRNSSRFRIIHSTFTYLKSLRIDISNLIYRLRAILFSYMLEGKLKTPPPSSSLSLPESAKDSKEPIVLSFSGSGFRYTYYLGVVAFLQQHYDLSSKDVHFCGASGGSLAAALLAVEGSPQECWEKSIAPIHAKFRQSWSGPCTIGGGLIIKHLPDCLPPDAYKKANGRLHVSVTGIGRPTMSNLSGFKNQSISNFDPDNNNSNSTLVDTLAASAYIPIMSALRPFFTLSGARYIDGGFTDNQPCLGQKEKVIKINPYFGQNGNKREGTLKRLARLYFRQITDRKSVV